MPVLSKNEKVFKNYLNLPPELRMMVVDEMLPNDRCRFTRCSELSKKEAAYSKNYIYGLQFVCYHSWIDILFAHNEKKDFRYADYTMRFYDKNVEYLDTKKKELWKENLENCTDWVQHAVKYFKTVLRMHQRTVRKLMFFVHGIESSNWDFGVDNLENLRNLKELEIYSDVDCTQYLQKARGPLEILTVYHQKNLKTSEIFDKIGQVNRYLDMDELRLNKQQFLQLSASDVNIPIGYLTEMDIYDIIRSWKNGTIGKKVEKYAWKLEESSFDTYKLFRLLGLNYDDDVDGVQHDFEFKIEHNENAKEKAILSFYNNDYEDKELVFKVYGEC